MITRLLTIALIVFAPTLCFADALKLAPIFVPSPVANYALDEPFLKKIEAVQAEISTLPAEPAPPATGNDNSIDGLVASVAGRPKLVAILTKNGLDPKNYVIGTMALKASLAAAAAMDDKDAIFDDTTTVSKQNLEFGKKYIDRIRKLFDQQL